MAVTSGSTGCSIALTARGASPVFPVRQNAKPASDDLTDQARLAGPLKAVYFAGSCGPDCGGLVSNHQSDERRNVQCGMISQVSVWRSVVLGTWVWAWVSTYPRGIARSIGLFRYLFHITRLLRPYHVCNTVSQHYAPAITI